jgi:hypothetical protein
VKRGLVVLHLVVDRNAHHVTPSRIQGRAWRDSVDEKAYFLATASPVACAIGDIKGVVHGVACGRPFL